MNESTPITKYEKQEKQIAIMEAHIEELRKCVLSNTQNLRAISEQVLRLSNIILDIQQAMLKVNINKH